MIVEERLSLLDKVIYGSGEWTSAIAGTTRSLFLNYFLVSVVGLVPNMVGLILLLGRIWDAVNDPLVGIISDRLTTRWGRRRPMMLMAALPLGVLFALLWFRPPAASTPWLFVYFVTVSLALDTVYTVFAVPHTALLAEITHDYSHRISIVAWRNAFYLLGALITAGLFKRVAEDFTIAWGWADSILQGYMVAGWLFGLSLMIAPVLIFWRLREPAHIRIPKQINPLRAFQTVFRNQPFRVLAASYFLAFTGLEFVVASFIWYLQFVLQAPAGMDDTLAGLLLLGAFVTMPLTNLLVTRFGKRNSYLLVGAAWIVSIPLAAMFPTGGFRAFVPYCIWLGFIYGAGITVPGAMLPDVMEYDELQTGERREGIFTSYLTFFRKLGSALAVLIVNFILARSGLIEGTAGTGIVQPQTVVVALRFIIGILPTLMVAGSLLVIRHYPITKTYHEAIKAKLKQSPNVTTTSSGESSSSLRF